MNENEKENGNSQIPEVEELVIEDGDDAEVIKTKVADYSQKVKEREEKVKENNAQLYARAKKAEGFELVGDKWVKSEGKKQESTTEKKKEETSEKGLSSEDVLVIINSKVPTDDIDEVKEYATFKKISIKDALETDYIKGLLTIKAEQRKVADGTNTEGGKRGSSKLSDDALMAEADKGKLPESDEDMSRLASLQLKKGR